MTTLGLYWQNSAQHLQTSSTYHQGSFDDRTASICIVCQAANIILMLCMQGAPRVSWAGLDRLKARDMRDSRLSTASCQPPQPTVLPAYVPQELETALPIWKVKGAVWSDSGCWALSCIQVVAARIRDAYNAAKGGREQMNLTNQQWDLVSAHERIGQRARCCVTANLLLLHDACCDDRTGCRLHCAVVLERVTTPAQS
jgi:hypothetical protein